MTSGSHGPDAGSVLSRTWSRSELDRITTASELEIAIPRADGTLRRWTPIWVVCLEGQVYVRTWYRRDTGWYGHALRRRRARIRVHDAEYDVSVEDLNQSAAGLRLGIDAAYQEKYGRAGSQSMLTAAASVTTLRLNPEG